MVHTDVAFEAPADDSALSAGTTLCDGQFTLTHQIGAGGFGLTYKAEDNVLGRTVVIKECFPEDFCMRHGIHVVPRKQQHSKQFQSIVRMFMVEARSLAKLRHPHIVGVHRAFEENNTAYMVLDLIEGEDLLDLVERNADAFTPDIVEDLLLKLLDAVERVHEMDLLHRDIAPDNIMIDKAGTPVLIDFGAARGDASRKTRMISSLLVVKDGYSPQEFYVAGSAQTPSSDLFALGATFYHLLTGEAPPNSQARMAAIAGNKEDPCVPLAKRVQGYSHTFLHAIDRAMKIMPNDRLQTAGEWRDLLTSAPKAEGQKPTPKKPSTPSKGIPTDLGQSLSKLIEETNVVVSKTRIIEEPPVVVAPPKPVSVVPAWVEEFNRETAGEDTVEDDFADYETPDTVSAEQDRTTHSKQVRTRIIDGASATDQRPTGWALDAIQQRKSGQRDETEQRPKGVSAAPNPIAAIQAQIQAKSEPEPTPEITLDAQDGWVKPVIRMGLMGIFFGVLVSIGTKIFFTGGA